MGLALAAISFECGFLWIAEQTIHQFCTPQGLLLGHVAGSSEMFPLLRQKDWLLQGPGFDQCCKHLLPQARQRPTLLTSTALCFWIAALPRNKSTRFHDLAFRALISHSFPGLYWEAFLMRGLSAWKSTKPVQLWITGVGFSLLFIGRVVWDEPSAGSSRGSWRKHPHTFQNSSLCLNKRLPRGNLPNTFFLIMMREVCWLIVEWAFMLSRGHRNRVCTEVSTYSQGWLCGKALFYHSTNLFLWLTLVLILCVLWLFLISHSKL